MLITNMLMGAAWGSLIASAVSDSPIFGRVYRAVIGTLVLAASITIRFQM
jgi:hypothetical protein